MFEENIHQSILSFKKELIANIHSGNTLDLNKLFQIMIKTEDPEIIGLVNELIYNRIDYYEDQLLNQLTKHDNVLIKASIFNCLLINPKPKVINRITSHYFEDEDDRPIINKRLFHNKEILANALNIYCNTKKLTKNDVDIVKILLIRVPREKLLEIPQIHRSRLFSIYQCIPPIERYEEINKKSDHNSIDENI